ncbi:MAG: alpha/beta hydrolase [Methanoregula sp.]
MSPVRKWGPSPYSVAVIHGGPGAPGEMATVAREISTVKGVLEPLQTETTLEGQVRELRLVLTTYGQQPVTLVGFSWGAFLSWIVAARYPELVKKLILVSSAPFEDQYTTAITTTRLGRLSPAEQSETKILLEQVETGQGGDKNLILAQLGNLLAHADAFDPLPVEEESFHRQYDIYKGVWDEASELRRKKSLLMMARSIACPVVAIHGDWDPHPADGVKVPLTKELTDFRFILLEKCGHRPWIERNAADKFYKILTQEI